ncbi:MAG: hypothetical protein H6667_17940 [Ardenticatenaceae bacterium]|nr:hypothetical protein [Ardenticatenaceae bacterium]MCB9444973.1 hypothetical protein [Ardenticatenaceae bacterium]
MALLLVAISNKEWSALVGEFLQENGFQVVTAFSLEESIELVKSRHLDGIVMTADWAIAETGDGSETLIGLAKDKIPTVTIVEGGNYEILDVVYYHSVIQEYVRTPFSREELVGRLERAMQNKKK